MLEIIQSHLIKCLLYDEIKEVIRCRKSQKDRRWPKEKVQIMIYKAKKNKYTQN